MVTLALDAKREASALVQMAEYMALKDQAAVDEKRLIGEYQLVLNPLAVSTLHAPLSGSQSNIFCYKGSKGWASATSVDANGRTTGAVCTA